MFRMPLPVEHLVNTAPYCKNSLYSDMEDVISIATSLFSGLYFYQGAVAIYDSQSFEMKYV